MVKVNVFPNPNLTFRTNLIFVTSSWNNDESFTSWFLFLNLLIASFASLSASPGNSQCWGLSIGSQGSHMTNWFLQKLYCMGTNWYMGVWTVRPSNSLSHVTTIISTDGNTLILEMIHDIVVVCHRFSWERLCASDTGWETSVLCCPYYVYTKGRWLLRCNTSANAATLNRD